ncbi:MAG: aminomethyl-transferring glycine dehydrogenase subunit GcvPA [Sedimentibacter sp.]|uniref:aminomethyl-transferring glycine dehydrogenase subunit GcvPA n=1 Tax=Sedimentibacter sp. TaxID=1960295 RepID=UPI0029817046|nr:aminomethyl-transferring glycine dehydrogenase subunit GcvPA [Sedimentibacter sp.]MDW5300148.1 aminomethyl-transferring glycine dehydrogenase subunit GcvPA [Sedimentibacter sp.]
MTRYIGNTDEDREQMLKEIGYPDIDSLFKAVPDSVHLKGKLNIPEALSEMELVKNIKELSNENLNTDDYACFLGAGTYDHYIPATIDQLISRQEFYTAYTPYQPEISQGTLQAIFEYQTMICELTGLPVANASMYDGATAMTEAAIMACEATKRSEILISNTVHPESRQVLNTYAQFRNMTVTEIGYKDGQTDIDDLKSKLNKNTAAVIIQSPNFFGIIEDIGEIVDLAHDNKSLLAVSADPVSLAILKSPGELGVDIAVGEGQSLGNPLNFGGPYLGFMAVTEKLMRKMPGRIVGQTSDSFGNRGFVLTMQTREQHIRREKATSNICSNQALNALQATMYLTFMGKEGLKKVAELCINKSHYAYNELIKTGKFSPVFSAPFFKEFVLKSEIPVNALNDKLLSNKIIGGYDIEKNYPELKNGWLVAVTEKRTKQEIDDLTRKVAE